MGIKAAFSKDTIRGKAEMESLREYGAYQRKNRSGNLTNMNKNVIKGRAEVEIKATDCKDVIRGKTEVEIKATVSKDVIRGKAEVGSNSG